MHGTTFDALTKRLATGTSRRRVLAGLSGALAGALVLDRGVTAAPGVGASCSSDADCLDSRCINGHCRLGGSNQTACVEALRSCLAQAGDTFQAAQQACRQGPRQTVGSCVAAASAELQTATAACTATSTTCASTSPGAGACTPEMSRCAATKPCCSGTRCVKNGPLGREAYCTALSHCLVRAETCLSDDECCSQQCVQASPSSPAMTCR